MMLDELDRALIRELASNARTPLAEVARRLGVARTTLAERLEKLEREGYIRGFTLSIEPGKLGYKFLAFILVKVRRGGFRGERSNQELLAEDIVKDCSSKRGMPWVEEIHIVTGEYDLLLKVWAREWDELTNFLIRYMPTHPDVVETHTMLVLKTAYESSAPRV